MRIVYLTSALPRPWEPGTPRPWHEATNLARRGHQVTVITSQRDYLTGELKAPNQGKIILKNHEAGFDILSVASTGGRRKSMLHRLMWYISLILLTFLAGLKVRDIDLVYVRTPPPLFPLMGWALARLKKARFIISIGDLHPEDAVALGLIKSTFLIRLWDNLENFARRRADLLVVMLPGMKQDLQKKGYAEESIHICTNAYDPIEERQQPLPADVRAQLETLANRFIVMYTGTMSAAHALEVVIEAAKILRQSHPDIYFVFVGHGDKLALLQKMALEHQLPNIMFFPPVPRDCMTSLLSHASALMYLTYAPSDKDQEGYVKQHLPNKFFEYLGSGKPFIFSGTGYISEVLTKYHCGMVVRPEDPTEFAEAVLYLYNHLDEAAVIGESGRQYIMENYNRQQIMDELATKLEAFVQQ